MNIAFLVIFALVHPVGAFFAGLGTTMTPPRGLLRKNSDASSSTTPKATIATPPRVQREYESWTWKNPHGSFRINYRVEGPQDGPPILLTHGFGGMWES